MSSLCCFVESGSYHHHPLNVMMNFTTYMCVYAPGKLICQWKITVYLHSWLFYPASHVNFQECIYIYIYIDHFVNAKSLSLVGLWASFPEVAI